MRVKSAPKRDLMLGQSSVISWPSFMLLALCVLLSIYALFPSESTSERLSLFVRTGSLTAAAALAISLGKVRRDLIPFLCGFSFIFILLVSFSNAPYFTPRLANLSVSILCAALVIGSTESNAARTLVLKILNILTLLSVSALFLQAVIYLITGSIFEIHGLLFPWGVSRSVELEKFGIARLSGLHTEPGTHSVYAVGLLLMRCFYGGRLFDRIAALSVASIVVTLSFWGIMAAALYLILYLSSMAQSRTGAKNVIVFIFCLFLVGLVFYLFAPQYLIEDIFGYFRLRSELGDGSGGAKVVAWEMGVAKFGDVVFFGLPIGSDYCNGCISPQDAGLVLNFIIYFGFAAALIFFGVFFFGAFRCGGLSLVVFGGLLLGAKFYYFDAIVWWIFFAAVVWVFRRSSTTH